MASTLHRSNDVSGAEPPTSIPSPRAFVGFSVLGVVMAAHALVETARDSLFLSDVAARHLPYAYLGIAALSWGVLRASAALSARVPDRRLLLAASLVGVAAIDVAFYVLLSPGDVAGLFALYVVSGATVTVVTVQFWLLLEDSVTATEAKRTFAPVAAGGVAGALVGALLARAIVAWTSPRALLLAAAGIFLLASALPKHLLGGVGPARAPAASATAPAPAEHRSVLGLRDYQRRMVATIVLATTVVTGVDYVFKSEAAAALPADELPEFFATFYVGLNATALVVQLAASGKVLRGIGVSRALSVMPTLLAIFAALFAWAPGLVAAMLLRGTDGALRHSLQRTGVEMLYLPLAGEARGRVKAAVDGLGHRGGQALSSLLVLAAVSLGLGPRAIGVALLVLVLVWLGALLALRPAYLGLYRARLDPRDAARRARPDLDLHALEAVLETLNSEDDRAVAAAIEFLEASGRTRSIPHVLLAHPSRRVVLRALDAFARDRTTAAGDAAAARLDHPDPEVRAAALRTVLAIDPRSPAAAALALDRSPAVRATALVGTLVASGGGGSTRARLALAARNGSDTTRRALAAALAVQPCFSAPEVLACLVDERRARIVRASPEALDAMAAHPDPRSVASLLPMLVSAATRGKARDALLAVGGPALGALRAALVSGTAPRPIRRELPGAIARFGGAAAADALLTALDVERDAGVTERILRGLRAVRDADPAVELDRAVLDRALARAFARVRLLGRWEATCEAAHPRTPVAELLLASVREERAATVSSLFAILDLEAPGDGFDALRRGLASADRRVRAAAREILDHVVTGERRRALLDAVDERRALGRRRHAARARRAGDAYAADLAAMLEAGGDTVRCVAAERIGELGLIGLTGSLRRARAEAGDDPAVREAIDRALAALTEVLTRRLPGVA